MKTTIYKNAKITYSDFGKGTVLVLLHGFLENQSMWFEISKYFARNYRIVTLDLLGHGQSDCLGYIHEMEEQAALVNHVLMELKIRKAIIIGHSMGGYVALAFAEIYPKMMKGLVLVNSTAKPDNAERKTNRDRAITLVKKDFTSFVQLSIANLFSEQNREKLIEEIELVKVEALKTPLQGIIAALEGMKIRKDRAHLLNTNLFPILLILGEKDPVLEFKEAKKQVENTKVEFVALSAGHMSHIENKAQVLHYFTNFLKSF